MTRDVDPARTIAFQGEPGAYSDLACRAAYPDMTTLPCASFEQAFAAVEEATSADLVAALQVAGKQERESRIDEIKVALKGKLLGLHWDISEAKHVEALRRGTRSACR